LIAVPVVTGDNAAVVGLAPLCAMYVLGTTAPQYV
jgi:hypothetical protein